MKYKNILKFIKLLEEWEDINNGTGTPVYGSQCKKVLYPTWEQEILYKLKT